eukprot:3756969-Karenia_brevis.AAC.1
MLWCSTLEWQKHATQEETAQWNSQVQCALDQNADGCNKRRFGDKDGNRLEDSQEEAAWAWANLLATEAAEKE